LLQNPQAAVTITTNICLLTNFTKLELTNAQANYGGNALWTPNQNFGGAMAP